MLHRRSSTLSTSTSKIRGRQNKIAFHNGFRFAKFILIVLLIIGAINQFSKYLKIEKISCTTNEGVCSDEFVNLLSYLKGKNIMLINKKEVNQTIKNIYPIEKLDYSFVFPSKLSVQISGWHSSVPILSYQVGSLPILSLDVAAQSSESGNWQKPSMEILSFIEDKDSKGQKLWLSGRLTNESVTDSDVLHIFVENPSEEILKNFYAIITMSKKYLENHKTFIFGSRILLSQEYQPDIIVSVPADIGQVESALQSIEYLYTIKKDAKVIDLSFKHPIIK